MNMRQVFTFTFIWQVNQRDAKRNCLLTRQLFQTKNDTKIFWETNHNYICLNAVRCAYNEGCFFDTWAR